MSTEIITPSQAQGAFSHVSYPGGGGGGLCSVPGKTLGHLSVSRANGIREGAQVSQSE